jgi:parvulin-like peptidyl-prolyl isomerase
MKTIAYIAIFCTLLTSCGIDNTEPAKKAVFNILSDPASAEFRNIRKTSDGVVCGEFHSKNKFGGYDNFRDFIYNGENENEVVFKESKDNFYCKSPKERIENLKKMGWAYFDGEKYTPDCAEILSKIPNEINEKTKVNLITHLTLESKGSCKIPPNSRNNEMAKFVSKNNSITAVQYREFGKNMVKFDEQTDSEPTDASFNKPNSDSRENITLESRYNEVRVTHIYTKNEDYAWYLLIKIKDGFKFDVAINNFIFGRSGFISNDNTIWQSPSNFPLKIANAIQSMEKGQIVKKPIQIDGLWHILIIDDIR